MEPARIFNFDDPVEYLLAEYTLKKQKNARFSLRGWSKQLGYKNPSYIAHILKGERKLKLDVAQKFSENLHLSEKEKKFFETLVLLKDSTTIFEKNLHLENLERIKPDFKRSIHSLTIDTFRYIADWQHVAIVELVACKDFKNNPDWIAKRLGRGLTKESVSNAIERLKRLDLISQKPNGKLTRNKNSEFLVDCKIPSDIIRGFHRQVLAHASAAIDSQTIEQRNLRASTIALKTKDYPKALKIIEKAHQDIVALSSPEEADEVYQLGTQFFRLNENTKEIK